ncbi:MAG TPA: nucleoside deaminase [Candidatus Thermoplasmatota archaeon]|nr:nucleoside deaminase [Candidatus Thermoplasmatota archaeon]
MPDPAWLPTFDRERALSPAEHMALAVAIAQASAEHGGGPFGAIVADAQGRIVEVGWNQVLAAHDSTAHAEIVAMRRAQARLGAHRLDGCSVVSSCAPCIQCFGAIYWSGATRVFSAATKEDAEAIGFDEGPPMRELWAHARAARGIEHVGGFHRDERALAPLRTYKARGGIDYSHD